MNIIPAIQNNAGPIAGGLLALGGALTLGYLIHTGQYYHADPSPPIVTKHVISTLTSSPTTVMATPVITFNPIITLAPASSSDVTFNTFTLVIICIVLLSILVITIIILILVWKLKNCHCGDEADMSKEEKLLQLEKPVQNSALGSLCDSPPAKDLLASTFSGFGDPAPKYLFTNNPPPNDLCTNDCRPQSPPPHNHSPHGSSVLEASFGRPVSPSIAPGFDQAKNSKNTKPPKFSGNIGNPVNSKADFRDKFNAAGVFGSPYQSPKPTFGVSTQAHSAITPSLFASTQSAAKT